MNLYIVNTMVHLPLEMDGLTVAVAAAEIRDIVVAVVFIATKVNVVVIAMGSTVAAVVQCEMFKRVHITKGCC